MFFSPTLSCMYTIIFLLYSLTFHVHADEGTITDPTGHHATVYSDEGSGLCPVGRMGASATADSGGTFDPNG